MPQPFEFADGVGLAGGTHMLGQRQAALAGIAQVAIAWTGIEDWLVRTFEAMNASHIEPRSDGGHQFSPSRSSTAVLEALDSLNMKMVVMKRVLEATATPEIVEQFAQAEKKIRAVAKARNRIVHGKWMVCQKIPEALILKSKGEYWTYFPRDFYEIVHRIEATQLELGPVWTAVLSHQHATAGQPPTSFVAFTE